MTEIKILESLGHWQNIIDHRWRLIDKLVQLNIKISDPNSMKTRELEELVKNHLIGGREHENFNR